MQRQGVPLLKTDAPVVGTGLERRAARDSGAVVLAEEDGRIEYVDGYKRTAGSPNPNFDVHRKPYANSSAGGQSSKGFHS